MEWSDFLSSCVVFNHIFLGLKYVAAKVAAGIHPILLRFCQSPHSPRKQERSTASDRSQGTALHDSRRTIWSDVGWNMK